MERVWEWFVIFQGVGVKYKERVRDFIAKNDNDFDSYSELCKAVLGFDIIEYASSDIQPQEDILFKEWILIYLFDCYMFKTKAVDLVKPKAVMGYSMGLITAMAAMGRIAIADGLNMLNLIYHGGTQQCKDNEAMGIHIGMSKEQIVYELSHLSIEETKIASNFGPTVNLIAGYRVDMHHLSKHLDAKGLGEIQFIDAPYAIHNESASSKLFAFNAYVDNMAYAESDIAIYSAVDKRLITSEHAAKEELKRNMVTYIDWFNSVSALVESNGYAVYCNGINHAFTRNHKMVSKHGKVADYRDLLR